MVSPLWAVLLAHHTDAADFVALGDRVKAKRWLLPEWTAILSQGSTSGKMFLARWTDLKFSPEEVSPWNAVTF